MTVDELEAMAKMPEKVLKMRRAPAAATKMPAIMISIRVEGVEKLTRSTFPKSRNPMVRTAIAASSMAVVTGNSKDMLRNMGPKTARACAEVPLMDGPMVELVSGPAEGTMVAKVEKTVPRMYRPMTQPTTIPTR